MRNSAIVSAVMRSSFVKHATMLWSQISSKWGSSPFWMRLLSVYTALFVVISIVVFWGYLIDGNTFIRNGDGWEQHFRALQYIGVYLRQIVRNILLGNFTIPMWDFSIGYGSDILTTMHYYGLGDPFTLISAAVPQRYTWVLYGALAIFKLYCAGLAFSFMCFKLIRKQGLISIVAGALVYVFSTWSLRYGLLHPMFITPMIYTPLIVVGIEDVIKRNKSRLLVVAVFLLGVSNIYIFCLVGLTCAVYAIVRLIVLFHRNGDLNSIASKVLQLIWRVLLGVLLAACVLLPVGYAMAGSDRVSNNGVDSQLLWDFDYYFSAVGALVANTNWNLPISVSSVALLAVILICIQRKNTMLKLAFVGMLILTVLPMASKLANGMLYPGYRWCFVAPLVLAFSLVVAWPKLVRITRREKGLMLIVLSLYFILCFALAESRTYTVFAQIVIMMCTVSILSDNRRRNSLTLLVSGVAGVCILGVSLNGYDGGSEYAYNTKSEYEVKNIKNDESKAIKMVAKKDKDTEFYRYSGSRMTQNGGLLNGVSSTSYYWSISNPYIQEYYSGLGLLDNHTHRYTTLDDRPGLLALASVKYYAIPSDSKEKQPYGFRYVRTVDVGVSSDKSLASKLRGVLGNDVNSKQLKVVYEGLSRKYKIYKNDYALPMGYTYTDTLSRDAWNKFNPIQKEDAMLERLVIDHENSDYKTLEGGNGEVIDVKISVNENGDVNHGPSIERNEVVATENNSKLNITYANNANNIKSAKSYMYLYIEGLKFDPIVEKRLYGNDKTIDSYNIYNNATWSMLGARDRIRINRDAIQWSPADYNNLNIKVASSNGVTKYINYKTPNNNWYSGRSDFAVPLGQSSGDSGKITITLPVRGVYRFSKIKVLQWSTHKFADDIKTLSKDELRNIVIKQNELTGDVDLDREKWLALSIPYSDGWTAYVDGKETKLYRANIQFMALHLDPGKHKIKLVYRTPLAALGLVISVLTALACLAAQIVIIGLRNGERKGHVYK